MKQIFLTLLLLPLIFLGCKETTTSPIITDIDSIYIDGNSSYSFYSTDKIDLNLTAKVVHTNGSIGDATDSVFWSSSNSSVLVVNKNNITNGIKNSGDADIIIEYKNFRYTIPVHLIALTDFNISAPSQDINSTGVYLLKASGNFEDGTQKLLQTNFVWDNNGSFDINETDYNTTININTTGIYEINATVFPYDDDINKTKTLEYNILE